MPLKTKNVFLTGGAQGLGKSYIDSLLDLGAKVFFGDISPSAGETTEKEFQAKYGKDRVKFMALDCTDFKKLEEAFAAAVTFLGHVDLMVNNAGIMDESRWEMMVQLNYMALVKGTLLAVEHMRKDKGGKGGRIINISSVVGLDDAIFVPIYAGTKHASRAFTTNLAVAPTVKEQGLEFGVLCPGPAATDLLFKMDDVRCRHMDVITPGLMESITSSVERVQSGFLKLVTLEEMNGAVLLVNRDQMDFYKVDKVHLGDTWPVAAT